MDFFFASSSQATAAHTLHRTGLIALTALLISGCGTTPPTPVNYAPSSVLSASGVLQVSEFVYLPALPTEAATADPKQRPRRQMAANQIRNTAIGNIFIDRTVSVFVRDAVFAELRLVGIQTNGTQPVLRGHIEEFLIDDLGYSIDWTLRVRYEVLDTDMSAPIYQSVKNTQRNTSKFENVFGSLNETIKLNAEELIKDPAFLVAIKQKDHHADRITP